VQQAVVIAKMKMNHAFGEIFIAPRNAVPFATAALNSAALPFLVAASRAVSPNCKSSAIGAQREVRLCENKVKCCLVAGFRGGGGGVIDLDEQGTHGRVIGHSVEDTPIERNQHPTEFESVKATSARSTSDTD
jgi:hypothetical protein